MALTGPRLTRIRILQTKLEVAKGDGTPPDTDIWVQDLIMNPTDPFVERKGSTKTLGHDRGVLEGTSSGVCSFTTELRTSGSQTWSAGLIILLQACGLELTGQVLTPTSVYTTQKSIGLMVNTDGNKKLLKGVMGTLTLTNDAGRLLFNFDFSGVWIAPTPVATPTPTFETYLPMNWGNAANVFTLDSETIKMANFTLDLGNTMTARMTNGLITTYAITDRDITMTMDVEADTVTGYDFYGKWLAKAEVVLSLAISDGTDKMTIAIPKFQYRELPEGDRDGILTHDLVGQCNRNAAAGDDEISLTVAAA